MSLAGHDLGHDKLLKANLPREEAYRLLERCGFADRPAAYDRLAKLAGSGETFEAFEDCLPTLLVSLSESANPDGLLVSFERYVLAVPDRLALYRYLGSQPRALEILVKLFVGSQFLTEILISNPGYLDRIAQRKRLAELKSREQFFADAQLAAESCSDEPQKLDALRRFQRWELLRIAACDSFGLSDLKTTTVQLSLLADSLVQACMAIAAEKTKSAPDGFVVLALGKLGGEELNYSSDIDLIFLADSDAPAHWQLGQNLIRGLTNASSEGFLYRVDMRLRPWGRSGPLVASADGYLEYLRNQAQLWEKQALIKARVIAGDFRTGGEILRQAQPSIYGSLPQAVRESVQGMKRRIETELHQRGYKWGEVKSGAGSIRDVEFVVQFLQLIHGERIPAIRSFNTLDSLVRLADFSILQADEYRILTDGYVFLRKVEHSLQLLHYKQDHQIPADPQELKYLARRLDFPSDAQFLVHYERHCAAIRSVYDRHLGDAPHRPASLPQAASTPLTRHLERLEPSYKTAFTESEIERHVAMAERIDESHLLEMEATAIEDDRWRVTVVAYDYLGELSLICGLLFVHGFDILEGQVFTYTPLASARPEKPGSRKRSRTQLPPKPNDEARQKIIDVFTVRPARGPVAADVWTRYEADLAELLQRLQTGDRAGAQGALVKRVADAMLAGDAGGAQSTLFPVQIEIDNSLSESYTVLSICAADTVGFLYELTNSLALSGVYIARVDFKSQADFAYDTLFVTDAGGGKITGEQRLRELRAATVLTKHFTHLLPHSPNPEAALLHFREFIAQLFTLPDWPSQLASLERGEVLDALVRLLGVSDFLWNDFLRMQHANLFPVVSNVDALSQPIGKEELRKRLDDEMAAAENTEARIALLNAFKDREMFRVDMRHIMGQIAEFGHFSAELSDVAEVVVETVCRLCEDDLRVRYGVPIGENGAPCAMSVCALGKCGGRELGFASDIELMFVYSGGGKTSGPQSISAAEYYLKLVESVTHSIRTKRAGIFEIDLRLRPYGQAGSLAVSLDAFREYFGPDGPAWPYERQALVKLRPIAGDSEFGKRVVEVRDALIYTGEPFDVAAMRGMRERQLRQLVAARTFNVKFSPGGLVDVEYLVQGSQITSGHRDRSLRATNTRAAIHALTKFGIFERNDAEQLLEAYVFLRELIDALRVVRGDAKDLTTPAPETEEFAILARRLGYEGRVQELHDDLIRQSASVQTICKRLM